MAGTLTISTLSDGTNSTSSTNCIQGSAKAWVNYKGTATRAINASYNVSSVTFTSTGTYTINFTNALADANYSSVACLKRLSGDGSSAGFIAINKGTAPTSNALAIQTFDSAGGALDVEIANIAVFR